MNSERIGFEEAARELGISEDELEQHVAAGEIAGVMEGAPRAPSPAHSRVSSPSSDPRAPTR